VFGEVVVDAVDAGGGEGVGGHHFAAGAVFLEGLEDVHDAEHFAGVIAGPRHDFEAPLVGLEFVGAAELEGTELGDVIGEGGGAAVVGGDAGGGDDGVVEIGMGHLLGGVAVDDVADLVAKDAREFALGCQLVVEGLGDEHLAAGEGEGVDGLGVGEEVELKGVGVFGEGADEFLAHRFDFGLAGIVGGKLSPHLGGHFGGGLEAQLHFLVGRDANVLGFVGDGVGLGGAIVGAEAGDKDEAGDDDPHAEAAAGASSILSVTEVGHGRSPECALWGGAGSKR
jgi:hypothetical protein